MSNNDSFIDEVTEEVRRDKLFAAFRRYGWIGVLAIIAIVGAAAFNEWQKAQAAAKAQAFGDTVIAALTTDDAAGRSAALAAVPADPGQTAILRLLMAADDLAGDGKAAAVKALADLAADTGAPPVYRQLAALKRVILMGGDLPAAERDATLAGLATAGAPYRPLAMEQQALALVADGRTEDAIKLYRLILQEPDTTSGLRSRSRDVIVALGGDPDAQS